MTELRYFNTALLLIFLTLKFSHQINWSWWWVLAPVWIPAVVSCVALAWLLVIRLNETEDEKNKRALVRALEAYKSRLTGP